MRKSKVSDIIQTKELRSIGLRDESMAAIETVRSMVNALDQTNNQINDELAEIDTYMVRLNMASNDLKHTYEKNKRIAQNFMNLLDESEE